MMSANRLQTLLREPLLHFLALGLLIFAVDAWWSGRGGEQAIVISRAQVGALQQNFLRTWQRPPTAAETQHLIEEAIRDEVLQREAVRLGLDRDDTVIRRRLRQKLEIITEEGAAAVAPSEAELEAFRQQHAAQFQGEARIAFEQVYFDPAKRGAKLAGDLEAALKRLSSAASRPAAAEFSRLGDALFVLQPSYPLATERALAASFGEDFVRSLRAVEPTRHGQWLGPLESSYGQHLVRIVGFEAGVTPALEQIRPLVEREWSNAQRIAAREAHYRELRARYAIRVEQGVDQK